jgi:hypothetical protein
MPDHGYLLGFVALVVLPTILGSRKKPPPRKDDGRL